MEKIFFMAGLPRSGGTLLASILNQNPDIYVSPNSVLANMLGSVYNQYNSNENLDVDQRENIYSVLDGVAPLFYETRRERFIVDKNFFWLDRTLFSILEKHLRNEVKIICPVREVLHMAASWNRMCQEDPHNRHDRDMLNIDSTDRSLSDKRADYFMTGNRIVDKIDNIKMFLENTQNTVLVIDYDNLLDDPKWAIDRIYNFLGIDHYEHHFDNLVTPHDYSDHWGVRNQHTVKPYLHREEYNIDTIFSKETIDKYSGLEFWKQN